MKIGARGKNLPVGSYYGWASGIVGLRLFPNPDFDEAAAKKWDAKRYYEDRDYYNRSDLVKPYRVAMSCGFCHVGPIPTKPPADPNNPKARWIAAAAAHMPLLFAVYVAANVNYGRQYNVLFPFLLIVAAGLLAIAWRGGRSGCTRRAASPPCSRSPCGCVSRTPTRRGGGCCCGSRSSSRSISSRSRSRGCSSRCSSGSPFASRSRGAPSSWRCWRCSRSCWSSRSGTKARSWPRSPLPRRASR